MIKKEITAQDVIAVWTLLEKTYASHVCSKADSKTMAAISNLLDIIGVLDTEDFMKRYSTTLLDHIYIPFTIGVEDEQFDLWNQLSTAIHEHHHVYQAQTHGYLQFATSYLSSQSARAHWEAEAFRTDIELYYHLGGEMPNLRTIAEHILHYGCRDAEVEYMYQFFKMSVPIIQSGAVLSPVCKTAFSELGI